MNDFVDERGLVSPMGKRLLGLMDDHLRTKGDMPFELRHYQGLVAKSRLLSAAQWLHDHEDKALVLWNYYNPDMTLDDSKDPFGLLK